MTGEVVIFWIYFTASSTTNMLKPTVFGDFSKVQ